MINIVFILSVIAGLFILVFLVVVHELGHAIVARRNGVKIEEFGIGFPPAARKWTVKKSFLGENVVYSLNWLPIGGFVSMKGENSADTRPGSFGAASFWSKTKIIFAGVAMNWLSAIVFFTILMWIGMPKVVENQVYVASDTRVDKGTIVVDKVVAGLPAEKAGLKQGDIINDVAVSQTCPLPGVAIDCPVKHSSDVSEIVALTKENPATVFTVQYTRDGQAAETIVTTRSKDEASDGKGAIGVAFTQDKLTTYHATWSAPIAGVGLTAQLSWETLKGLGDLVMKFSSGVAGLINTDGAERARASEQIGETGKSVAGPVGILFNLLPGAVSAGIVPILLISGVLSLTLAVMNILPIPALDGGRWYLMAIYKLLRKPLTQEVEERVVGVGMMIIMGLVVLITVADVTKLFK